jgi:hypothetical protein
VREDKWELLRVLAASIVYRLCEEIGSQRELRYGKLTRGLLVMDSARCEGVSRSGIVLIHKSLLMRNIALDVM